jgi:hypothetical protein
MPAREYVRAWAHYRFATLEHAPRAEQAQRASAIAHLHVRLRDADPVFRYLNGPLVRYLVEHEPHVPMAHAPPTPRLSLG